MKIVILDADTISNGDVSLEPITRLGDTVLHNLLPAEQVADAAKEAEVLICNKARITAPVMDACPHLKMVGLFATGYNNIDIKAAADRGITVCNVPSYSTDAVAQHVFSLLLALCGSIPRYNQSVHQGDWVRSKQFTYFKFPQTLLVGKTLGIFGYGEIGRKVAEIGKALGMNILVYTRTPGKYPDVTHVSKEELFRQSDVLTVHCPLTPETEKVVNRETLSLMKPTSFFINTARGGVMDEKAVADALNQGKIAGAGIDVLTHEPMLADNPLLLAENCILTPHIAWAPPETRKDLVDRVAENILKFQNGTPINTVKP
jgi:glycerate dehydrogenase